MKKYAFIFAVGGRVAWSGEWAEDVRNRIQFSDKLVEQFNNFDRVAQPGDLMTIEDNIVVCLRT